MKKGARLLAIGALSSTVISCSPLEPTVMDDIDLLLWDLESVREMEPQGSAFTQGLREGYLAEADLEEGRGDYTDFVHFARKAVSSAKGLNVQPDSVSYRSLSDDQIDELTAARARLIAAIEMGGRLKLPAEVARAQVAFDCWLAEEEENDSDGIARCKADFEAAMAAIESSLASDLDNVYVVFFAWDRAEITPVGMSIIENVAADYEAGTDITRLILAGHADRSGTEAYNLALSERRARSVAAELRRLGVPADALEIEALGESEPRVPTADGVREPQNRRVEIRFAE